MARMGKTLMYHEAYDIVIVGAGAAGCVVASYLAEHTSASIALIEAGGVDRDPFIHIPAGFANMLAHDRSEEHTSELQSLMRISYAVFCLKKKKTQQDHRNKPTK